MDNDNKIGALWSKISKKGTAYLSGVVTIEGKDYSIIAFENTRKSNPKQPDWTIMKREEWKGGAQQHV